MHTTPRRLYLGLLPGGMTQMALADHRSYWQWTEGAILPSPRRFHLTLHFLGEVDARREAMLIAALENVKFEGPVHLSCNSQQVWRNGVAVLLPDASEALDDLRDALGFAMFQSALPLPVSQWTPHVTLARNAQGSLPPDSSPPVQWEARDYALVWSKEAGTRRADYEIVARFPIAAPTAATPLARSGPARAGQPVSPAMPAVPARGPWQPGLAA
ncbi:MAG: 2'-5' RNA ligase family protein [Burkholderiaceae bacterium]